MRKKIVNRKKMRKTKYIEKHKKNEGKYRKQKGKWKRNEGS